jgi:nicotinamidase/pyrazinamidase
MYLRESDALLIVDVQRDFLPGGALAVEAGDEVVPVLARLNERFVAAGLPVIASRDWHPSDHCSFRESGGPWPPHCVAGTPGAEIDDGLKLGPGTRLVNKATAAGEEAYSAFEGTDLAAWLREHGVRRLFIGGLATDYCVKSTALDALAAGFDVVLLEDGVRAIDAADGRAAIEMLRERHAALANSDELLDAP